MKTEPTHDQVISILQNLASCLKTSSIVLERASMTSEAKKINKYSGEIDLIIKNLEE